jgi:amino acid permease
MDRDNLIELLLHYAVLFVLVLIVLAVVQSVVGEIEFWTELVIIVVMVFAYRPIVLRLGIAPTVWETEGASDEMEEREGASD